MGVPRGARELTANERMVSFGTKSGKLACFVFLPLSAGGSAKNGRPSERSERRSRSISQNKFRFISGYFEIGGQIGNWTLSSRLHLLGKGEVGETFWKRRGR